MSAQGPANNRSLRDLVALLATVASGFGQIALALAVTVTPKSLAIIIALVSTASLAFVTLRIHQVDHLDQFSIGGLVGWAVLFAALIVLVILPSSSPSPNPPPTPTPTASPSPTPTPTPTATPTPPPTPVAAPTPTPPNLMAFIGIWKYPYYESLGIQQIGSSTAGATLNYARDGGVYTDTAEIVFSSQSGDTLSGAVAKVYPGTRLFNVGDPVTVTLVDGRTKLQVSIGQNNPASRVLSPI